MQYDCICRFLLCHQLIAGVQREMFKKCRHKCVQLFWPMPESQCYECASTSLLLSQFLPSKGSSELESNL